MNTVLKASAVSVIALLAAAPVFAQQRALGIETLNDQIEDITDDVNTDLARGTDAERYGANGVAQGVNGGVKFGHCGGAKVGQFGASALERAALI